MPGAEQLELTAQDGYRLGAVLHRPSTSNGRAVQIHAAAGVKQQYYADFAAYLAARGFAVLTFDYRGVGRPAPGARMRDWAQLDGPAALAFMEREFPEMQLLGVGHSFGGQSFAAMPGSDKFAALLTVGSQNGYWKNWQGRWRAGLWLLTRVLLPAATRAYGYFPGAVMRQGENLPAGVALEWASWTRDPLYLVGALRAQENARKVTARLRVYCVADDFIYAPQAAVRALLLLYPNARAEMVQVEPATVGVERIGHFGFFRARFRDSLWREAADWLEKDK
jgi:predicted alpha/beta hydrolase